jgi:DNA-binding CsgD family transcriptional regulator
VADQLTPQEFQIALQVAEGKTNREVAAALFLSPTTVEFHLSRTYRKLGIRSRADLIRRFTEAKSEPPAGRPVEAGAAAGADVEGAS